MVAHVEPGAVVITDGLASYRPACGEDYEHRPEPIGPSGQQAHELLPGVHRVVSLAQRWLLGTHQGGVKPEHMQAYLDEFTSRFNRRRSRARGMLFYRLLEQAIQAPPRTYRSLVADPGTGRQNLRPRRPTSTCGQRVSTAIPSIARGARPRPTPSPSDARPSLHEMEDPVLEMRHRSEPRYNT
jgi:ISXO2-like transposase domain